MPTDLDDRQIPPISAATLRFFRLIVRGYFWRHFRAVMVQNAERLADARGSLIVFANHSSWWDPMVSVLLAQMLLPRRKHYAPMDAAALARYPILRRLGIFPVEMGTTRGAAKFLRTSQAILASGGVLWVTPQGKFADPRTSPLVFRPGLGALAVRTPDATLLPLAIEYTFWDERLPETLLRFGEPVSISPDASKEAATQQLETALSFVMQELKTAAVARDARAFQTLQIGSRGPGGFYGLGRRIVSLLTRTHATRDHTDRPDRPASRSKP
jgi:1-acyl-sn-glycerol-3-phosphate acyltransferase